MIYAFENERLHRSFVAVLKRLPATDRAVVQQRLTLVTDDRERAAKHGGAIDAKASVSPTGVLFVDAGAMHNKPEHFVQGVFAHELAHIALGHNQPAAKGMTDEQADLAADAQACAWGFRGLVTDGGLYEKPLPIAVEFGKVKF